VNIAIDDIVTNYRYWHWPRLHFWCKKYRCIFNHFYVIRHESYRIWWNYAAVGLLRRSVSFKVTEYGTGGTNRKLICDFLLVISTNLAPILQRFRDIEFNKSKIAIFYYSLTPSTEG